MVGRGLMGLPDSLHVLLVHVWFWPHVGGGNQHVEQIGRELVRRGHRVTVWCADVPAHEERVFSRGGMNVVRIKPKTVLAGVDPVVSISDLDLSGVDVVHLHDTLPILIRRTLMKAKRAGKPVVTTYHNDYVKKTVMGKILKFVRWVTQGRRTLHSSDARIVLTPFFERLLREKGVRGKLEVIPNGFTPVEEQAERPPGLNSWDGSRPLVSFVGRMSFQKGLDILMDAMESYDHDPGFDLAIAGKGELSDWLVDRHAKSRAKDHVSILGLVSDSEKRWLFENSECIVIPSRFEGLPTVLLEAMHAGAPVVMTRVNGLGEMVERAGSGISVPSEDPRSLASAMRDVIGADKEIRSAWISSGKEASKEYQWNRVTDRVLDVYRRVLRE